MEADIHLKRHCGRCHQDLPLGAFYLRNDKYVNNVCIECTLRRHRGYREINKNNLDWRCKQSQYSKDYYKRKNHN